jgi:hypothetical protein
MSLRRWFRKRDTALCVCEHVRLWHRHFDKSTDCTLCGCVRFQAIPA